MARQWAMRDDPACNSSQRMTSRVRTDICWALSLGMLINKSTYTRQPDLIRVGYIVSEVADVLEILVGMIYSVGWGGPGVGAGTVQPFRFLGRAARVQGSHLLTAMRQDHPGAPAVVRGESGRRSVADSRHRSQAGRGGRRGRSFGRGWRPVGTGRRPLLAVARA